MKKIIGGLLGCCTLAVLLSQCANIASTELSPESNSPAVNQGVSGSASGVWSGVVNYNVINGSTFQTPMRLNISPSQDRVTTVAGDSGADTVAARCSGNVVSWSILGPSMVTEVTLRPVSGGTARVTSRVIQNGRVMATGAGTFVRRG